DDRMEFGCLFGRDLPTAHVSHGDPAGEVPLEEERAGADEVGDADTADALADDPPDRQDEHGIDELSEEDRPSTPHGQSVLLDGAILHRCSSPAVAEPAHRLVRRQWAGFIIAVFGFRPGPG